MYGNVSEWTADWYGDYPTGAVSDPVGPSGSSFRVCRGGSWSFPGTYLRSAKRNYYSPAKRNYYLGFRVGFKASGDVQEVAEEEAARKAEEEEEAARKAAEEEAARKAAEEEAAQDEQQVPTANKAGDTFTIPDLSLEMLWVEPGTFTMGSPESEEGHWSDETQHEVTLTEGFWLGKYEVTQAQWENVMGSNRSVFKGANRPVENLNGEDGTSFCEKLTEVELTAGRLPAGMTYQLPTEAQWEYACRAGTTTVFSWGDTASSTQANFDGNYPYGGAAKGPYLGRTTDVGQYAANPWGFHDMHGNVPEWCADWYGDYPTGAVTDPVAALGYSYSYRAARGGSWDSWANSARSAFRWGSMSTLSADITLGFRLSLRPASK